MKQNEKNSIGAYMCDHPVQTLHLNTSAASNSARPIVLQDRSHTFKPLPSSGRACSPFVKLIKREGGGKRVLGASFIGPLSSHGTHPMSSTAMQTSGQLCPPYLSSSYVLVWVSLLRRFLHGPTPFSILFADITPATPARVRLVKPSSDGQNPWLQRGPREYLHTKPDRLDCQAITGSRNASHSAYVLRCRCYAFHYCSRQRLDKTRVSAFGYPYDVNGRRVPRCTDIPA